MELTRPKIESHDPIFFNGTRPRSRVSGNDRLFPRGSEFGPNPEIPASPVIQLRPRPGTSVLNRYVTEVTSINEHHNFFKMPISTAQFQSLLHCKCEANPNTNTLISGPTRATFDFIRKTKCWRAWHHVNWTSSACIYLHHYQIITTWILWGHYVRQLIL